MAAGSKSSNSEVAQARPKTDENVFLFVPVSVLACHVVAVLHGWSE